MRLIFALLLLWPVVAAAQISPAVAVTPHRLRTMTPSELRAAFFAPDAPEFVESWVEGPTRKIPYIDVELASRPRPTTYSGLCEVEIGHFSFRWNIHTQTEDSPLEPLEKGHIQHRFLLSSDRPGMAHATDDAEGCSKISALFRNVAPQPVLVVYSEEGSGASANADAAYLGFTAIAAAKEAAKTLHVTTERCWRGDVAIPLACNAPAVWAQTVFLRDVQRLIVTRCAGGATLCVDASIARKTNDCGMTWWAGVCGEDHLIIETDIIALSDSGRLDASRIRSILIRAGSDPVV